MEINIYSHKEKILQYIEYKGISKNKFYEETGLSNGFLDSGSSFSLKNLRLILDKYRDINIDWLIFDKGQMCLSNDLESTPNSVHLIEDRKNTIPLVLTKAIGGFGSETFSISEQDVKDYYIIPKFMHKKIDFMIEVEGSSMYPKYSSGDIVACRIIDEKRFIQWNKAHVVATKDQGIIIKRLKKGSSDESFLLVSDNPSYDPFEITHDDITGVALVIGVIRLE